jgi:hypothetical protein
LYRRDIAQNKGQYSVFLTILQKSFFFAMGALPRNFFPFPWLFAIALSAIIYLVLPDLFPRYVCKIVSERQTGEGQETLYADLDSDGNSEMLIKGVNHTAPSVEVRTGSYLLKAVWNLHDKWAYQSPLIVLFRDYTGRRVIVDVQDVPDSRQQVGGTEVTITVGMKKKHGLS